MDWEPENKGGPMMKVVSFTAEDLVSGVVYIKANSVPQNKDFVANKTAV